MPKYYCEYCDIYLTHSSPVGRRQHTLGRKHINAKIEYFQNLIREEGLTAQNFLGFLNVNPNLYGSGMNGMMNYMHPQSHQHMNMYVKPPYSKVGPYPMRGYGHGPFHNTFPNNKYQRPGTYYPPSYPKNSSQVGTGTIHNNNNINNNNNAQTPPAPFTPSPYNNKITSSYPNNHNYHNIKNNPNANAYGNPNLIQIPPRNIPSSGNAPQTLQDANNNEVTNSIEVNKN